MKNLPINIVGGTNFDRYKKMSIEQTINMMVANNALVPYAGYKEIQQIAGNGEARALYRSTPSNTLIAVIDENVYRIDANLSVSLVGALHSQTGPVFIAENNANQIAFVDGARIYIFTYGSKGEGWDDTISVDFNPGYIDYQDTRFIAGDAQSNSWFLSDSNNGKVWKQDPSSTGKLETQPDKVMATVAFNRQLFIMGKDCTEIWHDVGAQIFPYQRDNTLSIPYGCLSSSTIAEGFGLLVWLASNQTAGATIMVSSGGEPQPLSTDGIDFLLDKLEYPQDSSAFIFQEDGHIFYQITFPSDNLTLSYDFTSKEFYTLTDEDWNYHIAKDVVYFNNTHYFVSYRDSSLYELSSRYYTYTYTDPTVQPSSHVKLIPRQRICSSFSLADASRFIVHEFLVTLAQGQSKEIQKCGVSLSKDGGSSFGAIQMKTLNSQANRPNKLRFSNLGAANTIVPQFQFWGSGPFVIINAMMRVSQ